MFVTSRSFLSTFSCESRNSNNLINLITKSGLTLIWYTIIVSSSTVNTEEPANLAKLVTVSAGYRPCKFDNSMIPDIEILGYSGFPLFNAGYGFPIRSRLKIVLLLKQE